MSEPIKLVAFCGSLRKARSTALALAGFHRAPAAGARRSRPSRSIGRSTTPTSRRRGFRPGPGRAAEDTGCRRHRVRLARIQPLRSRVLKNAIDWLSRVTPQPFAGKPMAVCSAPGRPARHGRAQYHLRQMMIFLDGRFVNKPEVMIGAAPSKFTDGKFTDEVGAKLLADLALAWRSRSASAKAAQSQSEVTQNIYDDAGFFAGYSLAVRAPAPRRTRRNGRPCGDAAAGSPAGGWLISAAASAGSAAGRARPARPRCWDSTSPLTCWGARARRHAGSGDHLSPG